MVQKTFKAKGLPYVSELALENSRAMKALVQWNHEHGIRFFRSHPLLYALIPVTPCTCIHQALQAPFGGPTCLVAS